MTIDVRKQGTIYTVFEGGDGTFGQLQSFDAQPVGCFPKVFFSQHELVANYPGRSFRFVEKAKPEQATIRRDPGAKLPLLPQTQGIEVELQPLPTSPTNPEMTAVHHFQRLLDRHKWCAEDVKTVTKIQIEAVADLLIEMWPDMEEKLKVMASSAPKFTLRDEDE